MIAPRPRHICRVLYTIPLLSTSRKRRCAVAWAVAVECYQHRARISEQCHKARTERRWTTLSHFLWYASYRQLSSLVAARSMVRLYGPNAASATAQRVALICSSRSSGRDGVERRALQGTVRPREKRYSLYVDMFLWLLSVNQTR